MALASCTGGVPCGQRRAESDRLRPRRVLAESGGCTPNGLWVSHVYIPHVNDADTRGCNLAHVHLVGAANL